MSIIRLRCKLLLHDKVSLLCYIFAFIAILLILNNLNLFETDALRLPVGIIDEDNSVLSSGLVNKLEENPSLRIYQGDFDELFDLLSDGYINSIFIIDKGYSERIRQGRTSGLLRMYAAEDDRISSLVADMMAGDMLFDICINKAEKLYLKLDRESVGLKPDDDTAVAHYLEYVEKRVNDPDFTFAFDVEYKRGGADITAKTPKSRVYAGMIAAMLALLMLLIMFCASSSLALEAEKGLIERRNLTHLNRTASFMLEAVSVVLYMLPIIVLISVMIMQITDVRHAAVMFSASLVFCFLSAVVFSGMALLTKKTSVYQVIGVFVIIISGVCGFASLLGALSGFSWTGYTPIGLYIKCFVEQILMLV